MISYLVRLSDGLVIQKVEHPEGSKQVAIEGHMIVEELEDKFIKGHELFYNNGIFTNKRKNKVKTYKDNRREEYPSLEAQLDMLWHSMDTGTLPKAEPFYSSILTIKNKYPKT